ncbi:cyclopropane-fatty-acyl-phospholipid synthase [Prosthecobacter debontii]|uniref:Cyclopropane-fatty-acyl-phospholipid synthase n=1 Tax=Prosthecobacter debontii TaxID=48467 RepID=A0A1T4YET7_9BACT|nr:cyclopropane-fatty-acyl-phospholipid synthase family protein [Prosthecobacter debontii]SKB00068.1 cyclopropane-fatty-acyl-phospholipid synthase [Prosthecobacter debontii]
MNSTSLILPEAVANTESQVKTRIGLYEKLVMKQLSRFSLGALRMTLPDGREYHLGQSGAEIEAEMRVRNLEFFRHCALYGNIGFGESYVAEDWDTDDIAAVISWFIRNIAHQQGSRASSTRLSGMNFLKGINRVFHLLRPNSVRMSRRNISEHYDLGNDFYSLWLDATMTYSAARFEHAHQSLEEAQFSKYEALCQKLKLRPTDHVLEIGCGWGGFCTHAAREHGCRVTAVTISQQQFDYAQKRVKREGLEHLIEIRLQDYRHVTGQFDKIASIEMLEAVGESYLNGYFAKCHELLKPEGLLAFQVITVPDCRYSNLVKGVDWIQKHIFPGSLLLSLARFNQAINQTGDMFLHGLEDLGAGYAKTLNLWYERFNAQLDEVRRLGFSEPFIRKWNFYLKYCEAAFATRNISVVQAVYTRPNNYSLHQTWS